MHRRGHRLDQRRRIRIVFKWADTYNPLSLLKTPKIKVILEFRRHSEF
jgi:hypothetical protein